MLQEIKDIYNYRRDDNSPMLSTYEPSGLDFWKPYRDNFAYYDRLFMKKYRSWFPMDQEGDIEKVSTDFAYDVKSWLMINDKRYSELYRMQIIPDDTKYSLTDNVYENETIGKTTSNSGTFTKGSEQITDSGSNIYGAQSDTETKSRTYGEQRIDNDTAETIGATQKTTTNGTSAFNESGFSDTDRSVEAETARSNSVNVDIVNGSHTDSENNGYTHGTHTDTISNTRTDGQRIDTNSGTGSESITRQRSGNIGVRTVDEMLTIHKDTWVDFSFFELIFSDIARELLRGVI